MADEVLWNLVARQVLILDGARYSLLHNRSLRFMMSCNVVVSSVSADGLALL